MNRLTFDGLFCDIAICQEVPCKYPDTGCSQRQVWERLKEYEDTGFAPDDINYINSCTGLFFSKRKKLAQEFEKWASEFNVKNCPESVIAFLYMNGFLITNRILEYLKLVEDEEKNEKTD